MMDASPAKFPVPDPELILPRLGPIVRENVVVHEREFTLLRPSQSDHLLDDPEVRTAFAQDEYLPYWADLWPAARMLAKALWREPLAAGTHALELGCGLGLPGIVALSRGLRVTFSDYDPCALRFAADNARLNGFDDFDILQFDWRDPPLETKYPIILAADLVYELRSVEPLVALIGKLLTPGGVCYLTDADRLPAQALRDELDRSRMPYTREIVRAGEPGGKRMRGTLYRIRRAEAAV